MYPAVEEGGGGGTEAEGAAGSSQRSRRRVLAKEALCSRGEGARIGQAGSCRAHGSGSGGAEAGVWLGQ